MKSGKHHIEAFAALILFALYALCIFAVLFSGTRIFSRLDSRDEGSFNLRSIEGYIATRLRQSDFAGGISIEGESLVLLAEEGYESRVYCHEGFLYEIFTRSGAQFPPEGGERLLRAESMSLSMEEGILRVDIVSDSGETSIVHALRYKEEAEP